MGVEIHEGNTGSERNMKELIFYPIEHKIGGKGVGAGGSFGRLNLYAAETSRGILYYNSETGSMAFEPFNPRG